MTIEAFESDQASRRYEPSEQVIAISALVAPAFHPLNEGKAPNEPIAGVTA
jgi:hypothetical protein